MPPPNDAPNKTDVLVVGAGIAGLYMLHRLRELGFSAQGFEAGSGVGGTWYWNRYPGARCDIESMEYSYQFSEALQQEWVWRSRYATQPEILAYLEHVADRFDLRRDILFDTRVERARFDASTDEWVLGTEAGEEYRAPFCILATGCLSCRNLPEFEGLESFAGETYHTGDWPKQGVDLRGKRVAVIGTGSSGIQVIPRLAESAEHLIVMQRTAGYSVPARNRALEPEEVERIKSDYAAFRERHRQAFFGVLGGHVSHGPSARAAGPEERKQAFESAWQAGGSGTFLNTYDDLMLDPESNDLVREFVSNKIREKVEDARVAELLIPTDTFGCKRLCIDSDYYETYNRSNVELVSVGENPIVRIGPEGPVLADGSEYAVDVIVFATGFDAMTGALLRIDPMGRSGRPLSEQWAEGARSYLGLAVHDLPNLFIVQGPGAPAALSNMVPAIEQHVEWIGDCLSYLRAQGYRRIEAEREAQEAWARHVAEIAEGTLYTSCNSWYLGSNVPGKPRVFLCHFGFAPYVERCEKIAAKGYEGFRLSR